MHVQEWICLNLASSKNWGIASGIDFLFLHQSLGILSSLFLEEKIEGMPNEWELSLKLLEILTDFEDPLLAPLSNYFGKGNPERKIFSIVEKLVPIFLTTALYGEELELQRLLQAPKNWKEALWRECFKNKRLLKEAIREAKAKENLSEEVSIHLFGFSHFPPVYFDLFEKIGSRTPLFCYTFSPCQMFWADHLSIREKGRLLSFYKRKNVSVGSLLKLQDYLDEENLLLANSGKVGREFATLLEERNLKIEEEYTSFEKPQKSLLEAIQNDILTLDKTDTHCIDQTKECIETHIYPTPYREIEGLKHRLLALMEREKALLPNDILVLAPNISEYAPFIRAQFEEIPYKITDLQESSDRLIMGLLHLLTLSKKRWSSVALLELFAHPLFAAKHELTQAELLTIKRWIVQTGIYWGATATGRSAVLAQFSSQFVENIGGAGSWEEGLKQLFVGLATGELENSIDFGSAELLGRVKGLLGSLEEDLAILEDGSLLSFEEWILFLKCLIEAYFVSDGAKILTRLEALVPKNVTKNRKYSFKEVFPFLERELRKENSNSRKNPLNAILFASLLPMRILPAKVICLIGVDQEHYPRKERFQSLQILEKGKSDYFPSPADFDKYLFLEALFSARAYLHFSYVGFNAVDSTEIPCSSSLQELRQFVEENYQIVLKEYKHPLFFNKSIGTKKNTFTFKPEASIQPPVAPVDFDLKDLNLLARSPLHYYFKHNYGLYFSKKETIEEEEPFVLSHLDLANLRKGLFAPEKALAFKEKKILQAVGLQEYAQYKFKNEKEALAENLKFFEIDLNSPSSIKLLKKNAPSIQCDLLGSTCHITGLIPWVCDQGLLSLEKKGVRGIMHSWPSYLLFRTWQEGREGKDLFMIRERVKYSSFFEDPSPHLTAFVEYAWRAKQTPIALSPLWILPIIRGDEEELAKSLQLSFASGEYSIQDPALLFAYENGTSLDPALLIEKYQSLLIKPFKELIDAWG